MLQLKRFIPCLNQNCLKNWLPWKIQNLEMDVEKHSDVANTRGFPALLDITYRFILQCLIDKSETNMESRKL